MTHIEDEFGIESSGEVERESKELIYSEVLRIESEDIRTFVVVALSQVDPKFWVSPASSTGKYHPAEDNGEGGLVRHVYKGSAGIIDQYGRRSGFGQREVDMARAAFLLHDTCKNGVTWGEVTDYSHGLIASQWLEQFTLEDEGAKREILNAVRYHMSQWSYAVNPFENRFYLKEELLANLAEISRALADPSRIELAVQEADYWSSRKEMSFFPGVDTDWNKDTHDAPEG